ncbi:MAG: phosphatase PAP2 family protein [Prolixibacteraceae bacterium]
MIELLRKTKVFSVPFFILVGGSSLLLLFYDKIEIALWINSHNNKFLDFFFQYFTHVGDGITAAIVSLVFLMFNIRKGSILLISYLLSGLIIQMLKIHVFPDILRPISLIGNSSAIHLVEGVKIWGIQSFPSGHTGTAFGMFFCLVAYTNNTWMQFLGLITSVLIAYSRLYLFQHFLPDVVAGAVIGTLTSLFLLALFEKYKLFNHLDHPVFKTKRTYAEKNN